MQITLLKGKIHRATVIEANLNYEGSITVDADLLCAAGILEYELVHVVDINNGNRFETYTIAGTSGSGIICVNGAAARCVHTGDKIILMSYASMTEQEALMHKPNIVMVNEDNKMVEDSSQKLMGSKTNER